MKRLASSFLGVVSVPLTMVFGLITGPARLYAESGVPFKCSTPQIQACSSKSAGDGCQVDAGPALAGFCQNVDCMLDDGAVGFALPCFPFGCAAPEFQACAGMAAGDVCFPDANGPTLRCEPTPCAWSTGSTQSALACSLTDGGGGDSEPIDAAHSASIGDESASPSGATARLDAGSMLAPGVGAESSVGAASKPSFGEAGGASMNIGMSGTTGTDRGSGGGCSSAGASPNDAVLSAIGLSQAVCLLLIAYRRSGGRRRTPPTSASTNA